MQQPVGGDDGVEVDEVVGGRERQGGGRLRQGGRAADGVGGERGRGARGGPGGGQEGGERDAEGVGLRGRQVAVDGRQAARGQGVGEVRVRGGLAAREGEGARAGERAGQELRRGGGGHRVAFFVFRGDLFAASFVFEINSCLMGVNWVQAGWGRAQWVYI